ncbi:MAG: hypothetical protein PHF66_12160 [Desulfobacteraceae bacterium]|nr:hypothetical protein [Desulfobacteraceae bacterium]MDD3993313.1 hypothetical protein [Desulfobacteraceae bacterium]
MVHRDYTSHASVQVMLFRDRLEVWNPGILPPADGGFFVLTIRSS